MAQAVDSSGVHTAVSARALADAGISFALRYHYNITRAEVDTLHAAGVGASLIAEFDTKTWHPPLHSPELGTEHGEKAVAVAQRTGFPAGAVLWLTADTYIGNFPAAGRYWELAAPIIRRAHYRVGAYGGSRFIDWLHDQGHADATWQCGAASWNEYTSSRTACLEQLVGQPTLGGVTVDMNAVRRLEECGAWMPDGVHAAPRRDPRRNPTLIPQEEPDMVTIMGRDPRDGRVYEFEKPGLQKRYVTSPDQLALLMAFGVEYVGDMPPALVDSRVTIPFPGTADAPVHDEVHRFTPEEIANEIAKRQPREPPIL